MRYGKKSRPSGEALRRALDRERFSGEVKFGFGVNKRQSLVKMAEAGVPVPRLYARGEEQFPCVGRPDNHAAGRGFWYCRNRFDVAAARRGTRRKAAATHFMEFVRADKEFRVHVVDGKSIKIQEKVPTGGTTELRRNHLYGYIARYPSDFHHKKTLRKWAIMAVEANGLDFGAVDILWSEEKGFTVLEVNSGPCLTGGTDTLDRYVRAFIEREKGDAYSSSVRTNDDEPMGEPYMGLKSLGRGFWY